MRKLKNIKVKTQKPTFTKSDLKTGDVVLRRNGMVGIVILEFNNIINPHGYTHLEEIDENFKFKRHLYKEWDIIAVRRPIDCEDCQYTAFEYKIGVLVYSENTPYIDNNWNNIGAWNGKVDIGKSLKLPFE